MPIYEYQCQDCEHVFDVLQKMSDDPLTYCPECGEPKLRKLLSAPNFRLKGGGWYETDFKDKNKRNLAGSDDAAKSSSDAPGAKNTDAGNSDSKPAAAKESTSRGSAAGDSGSSSKSADN